jgi:copper transport protein
MARATVLALVFLAASAGLLAGGAKLVSAHASLLSTSPSSGQVLDAAPPKVSLVFDEAVNLNLGDLRLLDGSGKEISGVGKPQHPSGNSSQVEATVPPDLPDGSYIVSWSVVSDDGHPIAGAFTFQIGDVNDLQAGVLSTINRSSELPVWLDVAESAGRALLYAALAVALGGLVFLTLARPDVGEERVRRVGAVAAAISAAAGLVLIPLQAEAARRGSFGDPSAWWDLVQTRNGEAQLVRLVAMAVVAVGLAFGRRRAGAAVAGLAGFVAVIASAPAGHGASGKWQVFGAVLTVAHVGAMAVWMGGLVGLALVAKRADIDVAKRFSPIAAIAMLTVVATGTLQSIRQLGSIDALTDSTYGKWLLFKIAAVALVLCGAMASRYATYGGLLRASGRSDRDVLRRALVIEIVAGMIVLGATGALTGTPPPGNSSAIYSTTATDGDYLMSLTVDPTRAGPTEMHVYLSSPNGSLDQPAKIDATLSNPDRNITDVVVQLEPSGPGHYTSLGATLPFKGRWILTVQARYGEFDLKTFRASFEVR